MTAIKFIILFSMMLVGVADVFADDIENNGITTLNQIESAINDEGEFGLAPCINAIYEEQSNLERGSEAYFVTVDMLEDIGWSVSDQDSTSWESVLNRANKLKEINPLIYKEINSVCMFE